MIKANISEVKNRLSYYLRLVRGGEQVEILDRNTPLARIVHVSQLKSDLSDASWIGEVERLGIVSQPKNEIEESKRLNDIKPVKNRHQRKARVLAALLEERGEGR